MMDIKHQQKQTNKQANTSFDSISGIILEFEGANGEVNTTAVDVLNLTTE